MIKPTHKGATAPIRYQEQNDCSVRSIANAKNITYEQSHNLLKSLGRVNGCTTSDRTVAIACVTLGGKLKLFWVDYQEQHTVVPKTLKRYMYWLSTGRYVVFMQNHTFALVDGCIIDDRSIDESEIVTCVYEFK